MNHLPVEDVLPELLSALRRHGAAVLRAPPGAGKTTRVPPALVDAGLAGDGQVVVLQPRRIAARAAARRIAFERASVLGEEVGYQVRFDRKASSRTRILVVTEGILTRRIQSDPFLDGVGAVVLDEFHERSIHADLALAFLRELRGGARADLRLVVMSATFDTEPISRFLDGAPVIETAGRSYPVAIEWLDRVDSRPSPTTAAAAVRRVLREDGGHVLVFLPGVGEILRCCDLLSDLHQPPECVVLPLYGDLDPDAQDRVLAPGTARKVIVATNVAETSLTIDGVTAVIDSGLVRRLVHDPSVGIDHLVTAPASRASCEQRAGRAGRTAPGRALRLWTRNDDRTRPENDPPEILRSDLASTVLEVRAWGSDPHAFAWFERPAAPDLERATQLLENLGALPRGGGAPTPLGRRMLELPVHPRLGRILLAAEDAGCPGRGARLAALCSERDIVSAPRGPAPDRSPALTGASDLLHRLDLLHEAERARFRPGTLRALGLEPRATRNVARVATQLQRLIGSRGRHRAAAGDEETLLRLLLVGFPDRVARRREKGSERALMVGGRGLRLARASVVRDAPLFLAVAVGGAAAIEASVRLASRIEIDWLTELFPDDLHREEAAVLDPETGRVQGLRRLRFRDLVLEEVRTGSVDPVVARVLLEEALRADPAPLQHLDADTLGFITRVRCLGAWLPDLELPPLDEADLVRALASLLPGCRSLADLRTAPLLALLRSRLTRAQREALERDAPERIELPAGGSARLHYEEGRPPILRAKVQQLFGLLETPRLARGTIPCLVELLGPNFRPVQLTQDLQSFWRTTYEQVRKDLRSRYPKHAWPEVPPGL